MAHIALYRTWRPQAFREIVGQKPIVQTLQNSLREGRISHAYLFSGPRGTGKTSAAKILAKAVNCVHGLTEEPCNECSSCLRITDGAVLDVVEIDAASNRGVEEIRDIRDKVKYAPTEVRRKVYIIDEVHMLTTEAFNALLKTLEEPPAHVMFILATTEPHKLPATIISRCQRFDFRRVSLTEQVERLRYVCQQENIDAEEAALQFIGRLSEGGMRDAVSLLDQMTSFGDGTITYDDVVSITGGIAAEQFKHLAEALKDKDMGRALRLVEGFMQDGKSADKCIESLIHYFRDLLIIRMAPDSSAVTERIVDPAHYQELANSFAAEDIFRYIDELNHYHTEMKYSAQPQTLLEIAVMKLCSNGRQIVEEVTGQTQQQVIHRQMESDRGFLSTGSSEVVGMTGDGGGNVVSAKEWEQAKQRIAKLEQQIERLLQGGGGQPNSSIEVKTGGSGTPLASQKASGPTLRKSGMKWDGYIKDRESPVSKQAKQKWNQVLAGVKERQITIHAWLVNGEFVSVHEDNLLLAFKNDIHRETTEKPANKQLIESVIAEVLGHPFKLVTAMLKDWKDAMELPVSETITGELMQMETMDSTDASAPSPAPAKEPWVEEAYRMFGEEIVIIKEE